MLKVKVMDSDTLNDDTLGEHDINLNLLEIPPDGEGNKQKLEIHHKNEKDKKTGVVYLSFSRMAAPKGAFEGILHVTVHKIDEFDDSAGFMDKVITFLVCIVHELIADMS